MCVLRKERRREERKRERVYVWKKKKEAEPVNGELAGFLSLETTTSAVTFHVDTIIDSNNNTTSGNRRRFEEGAYLT